MKKKKLIIRLIKDHLVFTRLVNGLDRLGLESEYSQFLSDTIFQLMGVADEDDLFEEFLKWCENATNTDIYEYPKYLDNAASSIYKLLKKEIKYIEDAKRRKENHV